jgi:hypothetical protein
MTSFLQRAINPLEDCLLLAQRGLIVAVRALLSLDGSACWADAKGIGPGVSTKGTSAYAAIARWPDPTSGSWMREHPGGLFW